MAKERIKRKELYLLILLLGIILRLYRLGTFDLWFDEAWKAEVARSITTCWLDHRPLFNLLLFLWRKGVGESEFALRLLPALFGIFSIPLFYMLSREFLNSNYALLSTLLFTLSPFHIWYCQELRAYTLTCLLVISNIYFFTRACKGKDKWWFPFSLSLVLSFYTIVVTFLLLPIQLVYLLLFYPQRFNRWFLSVLVSLIFFIPRLGPLYLLLSFLFHSFWPQVPTLKNFLITWENMLVGYNSTPFLFHFSFLLSFPLVFLSFLEKKDKSFLPLFGFLFPLVALYFFSIYRPFFIPRLFLPFTPFLLLSITLGLEKFHHRFLKSIAITLLLLLFITSLTNHYRNLMPSSFSYHIGVYPKKNFKPIISYIKSKSEHGEIIAHTNAGTATPFIFYSRKLSLHLPQFYFILPEYQDPYWRRNLIEIEYPPNFTFPIPRVIPLYKKLPFKKVWLILSDWARDWNIDYHSEKVRDWMLKEYRVKEEKWMEGVLIILFEKGEENGETPKPLFLPFPFSP